MAAGTPFRTAGACPVTLGLILTAILLPLVISEFSELAPWTARKLLVWGARRLPSKRISERYEEEWLAGINEVPGKLTKLVKAISIVFYMVPLMNWRANQASYLWPARRAADALLYRMRPSLAVKRRQRLISSYEFYFGQPLGGSFPRRDSPEKANFTIGQLVELVNNSHKAMTPRRILPETDYYRQGPLVEVLDHRRKRVAVLLGNAKSFHLARLKELTYREPDGSEPGRVQFDLE